MNPEAIVKIEKRPASLGFSPTEPHASIGNAQLMWSSFDGLAA